jgi:4-amino-4-deoxy-L-arabinose transferase-like glycosyltransferase
MTLNKKWLRIPGSATSLFLFLALLFIRLPFFFRDYVDRDESTFILMGQSIADGYLPYDHLWDLKPPLLFYLFGLIETIFPHSMIAIRLFGVLVIFGSVLLLLQIAKRSGLKNGLLIAFSYVILSSMFGSVQGVMSEHVAVFFMLAGLFFFIKKKTIPNLFIAGLLFGCALLCKMNYAYAVLAILIYHFISSRATGVLAPVKNIVFAGTGIVVSFVLAAAPFMIHHKLSLFIDSVFLAPFEYGHDSQMTIVDKLRRTWWIILAGLAISFFAIKKTKEEHKEIAWLSVLIILATIYTFFSAGMVNGHYLIQVYPFIILIVFGIILTREIKPSLAALSLLTLLLSIETWIEYSRVLKHYNKYGTWQNGNTYDAIRDIRARQLDTAKIFFVDYHIGYWLLHKEPLTKSTTHPSNITRPYLFKYFGVRNSTSMQELKYLFEEVRPDLIVSKNKYLSFFMEGGEENLYFAEVTDKEFDLVYNEPGKRIYIWRRKGI